MTKDDPTTTIHRDHVGDAIVDVTAAMHPNAKGGRADRLMHRAAVSAILAVGRGLHDIADAIRMKELHLRIIDDEPRTTVVGATGMVGDGDGIAFVPDRIADTHYAPFTEPSFRGHVVADGDVTVTDPGEVTCWRCLSVLVTDYATDIDALTQQTAEVQQHRTALAAEVERLKAVAEGCHRRETEAHQRAAALLFDVERQDVDTLTGQPLPQDVLDKWGTCTRADAIRQCEDRYEAHMRALDIIDSLHVRAAERDDRIAELERAVAAFTPDVGRATPEPDATPAATATGGTTDTCALPGCGRRDNHTHPNSGHTHPARHQWVEHLDPNDPRCGQCGYDRGDLNRHFPQNRRADRTPESW